jgi:branched-chain amino acid transport system substrate-binding protein
MKRAMLALSLSVLLLHGCGGKGENPNLPGTVTVGAILDVSGSASDFTPEFTAACQLAVEDENARLAGTSNVPRFGFRREDAKSTPDGAKEATDALAAAGVHYAIGPRTSAQCAALLPSATANDIAILATRSVADDLALPNDALFRLITPDRQIIPRVAEQALSRGLKYVCVLYRNDPFGNNALAILDDALEAAGGDVVYSQAYDPSATPSDTALQTFAEATIAQRAIHGDATGVAYFSLSEMVPGFAKLNAQPDSFRTVRAVSAQSLANVPSMVTNEACRLYCQASGLEAVSFALASQPAVNLPAGANLLNRIAERSGKANPDELAINVYDGMRALLRAAQRNNGTAVQNTALELASSPMGTLSPMTFDENGDRVGDYYGVYRIEGTEDPKWVRSATLRD